MRNIGIGLHAVEELQKCTAISKPQPTKTQWFYTRALLETTLFL